MEGYGSSESAGMIKRVAETPPPRSDVPRTTASAS